MRIKLNSLLLGICLLAKTTFASDPVAPFVKDYLKFDLASVPFGTSEITNNGFGLLGSSFQTLNGIPTNILAATNALSEQYKRDFPNRSLRYNFRDGKLASVQISISVFDGGAFPDKNKLEQRRDELSKILNEIRKVRKTNAGEAAYHVDYNVACGGGRDDLFFLNLEFSSVEKKKSL